MKSDLCSPYARLYCEYGAALAAAGACARPGAPESAARTSPPPKRRPEGREVLRRLISVRKRELADRAIELLRSSAVAVDHGGVAGPRMRLRKELAREARVFRQSGSLQISWLDRGLVIRQLSDEEIAPLDLRPAEKRIAQRLHAVLGLGDAPALVRRTGCPLQERGVGRRELLLDLEKERRRGAGAHEHHDVIPRADTARADHLEGCS